MFGFLGDFLTIRIIGENRGFSYGVIRPFLFLRRVRLFVFALDEYADALFQ